MQLIQSDIELLCAERAFGVCRRRSTPSATRDRTCWSRSRHDGHAQCLGGGGRARRTPRRRRGVRGRADALLAVRATETVGRRVQRTWTKCSVLTRRRPRESADQTTAPPRQCSAPRRAHPRNQSSRTASTTTPPRRSPPGGGAPSLARFHPGRTGLGRGPNTASRCVRWRTVAATDEF
jgi:hypothetical protein